MPDTTQPIDELPSYSFHHVGVSVADLQGSIDWYSRVLGFELARTIDIPSLTAKVAVLRNGSMHVELFQVTGAKPPSEDRSGQHEDLNTFGTKHVGFVTDDVRALVKSLEARGAAIVSVNDFRFGTNAFIHDNSGNLIEFVQSPQAQSLNEMPPQ